MYWADEAREGGDLDSNDIVFGQHWTKYCGLYLGLFLDCNLEEPCDCERYNCIQAQSTVPHTAVAAT
jgi:hypothetical protein